LKRKAVLGIMLTLLFIGILSFTFDIQQVEAGGTITIKADGSIEGTTDIMTVDNVTYTFTDNINDSIFVERDNIVVDGAGFTLQGTGAYGTKGIALNGRSNVSIKDIEIQAFGYGIWLNMSSNSTISVNNITNNGFVYNAIGAGIYLEDSSGNNISGNNITNNRGTNILLFRSSNNSVLGNTFSNNGLYVYDSYENVVEDNLANDKPLVYLEDVSDYTIDNAGQVILVNCDNILVEKLDLLNTTFGVELWGTNNTNIANNTITNNGAGVTLWYSSNNNIYGNDIENNANGIRLSDSSNNIISGNNITNNYIGISLIFSFNNTITNNIITNTNGFYPYPHGLDFHSSSNNRICKNTIAKHEFGISFDYSSDNIFYYNNFVNNKEQVTVLGESINCWNYSLEGNFWSNYVGVDLDNDGIGDTMHYIGSWNADNYPLMGMFHSFNTSLGKQVNIISNSTIESFTYFESNSTIIMHVSNMTTNQTYGFCRVRIPHALMSEPYNVTIDEAEPYYANYTLYDDEENMWIYFSYQHSILRIVIVPEFPSLIILPLFMIATLLSVIIYRRKHSM
jgi:parallel beta-helix repeat protein